MNDTLDNFLGSSTTEGSLYEHVFGDDALRFASHKERYLVEGFA
jgi:hypothetical protein